MSESGVATEVAARQGVAPRRVPTRVSGWERDSNPRSTFFRFYLALFAGSLLISCTNKPSSAEKPAADTTAGVRLANPASKNCVDKGGTLAIEEDPSGGQFGVCSFPENHQCEEWAMLRGHCPVGGIKVTGYVTPAARFCGITGGQYSTTGVSDTAAETGTCVLPSGEKCDADAYFKRTCPPAKSSAVVSRPFGGAG